MADLAYALASARSEPVLFDADDVGRLADVELDSRRPETVRLLVLGEHEVTLVGPAYALSTLTAVIAEGVTATLFGEDDPPAAGGEAEADADG